MIRLNKQRRKSRQLWKLSRVLKRLTKSQQKLACSARKVSRNRSGSWSVDFSRALGCTIRVRENGVATRGSDRLRVSQHYKRVRERASECDGFQYASAATFEKM